MRRLWIVGSVLFSAVLAQPEDPALHPNSSVQLTLPGGANRSWPVSIPRDQTAILEIVEQQGLAGVISVLGNGEQELVTADLDQRHAPVRNLLIPPGAVRIRMQAVNHASMERIFELRIGPPRAVEARDRVRMEAEQLTGQAERLFAEQKDGYLDAALDRQQKALVLWKQLNDAPRQATALLALAALHVVKRETKTALTESQTALDLRTAGHDQAGMADALNEIAVIGVMQEQAKVAGESIAKAIELARAAGDTRILARGQLIEADIRKRRGQTAQALAEYLEGLRLIRSNGDRLAEADALSYLGTFEQELGRLQESADHGMVALAINKEEGDGPRTGSCLVRLSNVYASLSDFRKAIAFGEEALPILKNPAAPFKYANALYNVGSYYAHIDEYPTALKDYTEALGIFRATGSVLGQAYASNGLANLYLRMGDDDKADSYYLETATQFRKASSQAGEVTALLALGGIAIRRRQFSKALELDRQALDIARASGNQRLQESSLSDLAEIYFQTHDYKASAEQATLKLELIHNAGYAEEEVQASGLRQLGRARCMLREYAEAQAALDESLALYESVGIRKGAADTIYELAILDRDRGRLPEASARIAKALDYLDALGAGAGSAESRMRFAAAHRKSYELAIDLAMQLHDNAKGFELSERSRTRILVDLIRSARLDIRQGVDQALLERERSVQESLNEKEQRFTTLLAGQHNASAAAKEKKELEDLVERYATVEADIRRASPRYAALVEPRSLGLGTVQATLLEAGTAMVEFWLGDERSYAWVVTKTACQGFPLPPGQEVESVARRAYAALTARNVIRQESPGRREVRISEADLEYARLSAELSRMLAEPLKATLGARHIWVVSDGALEYLPFAALPVPGTSVPLIAAHAVAHLPSASVLAEVREQFADRQPAPRSVAVFADPVFQADDERVVSRSTPGGSASPVDVLRAAEDVDLASLPRLWFSRREAEAVMALAPSGSARQSLDFDASRTEAEKPALADYRIIHLATHAFLDSRHPELSGLVLSMVDRAGHARDGLLRLHEIYNLKLNADLVVLSGCQTALGQEVRSEGLVGLTRGFMYAGAPQVLASLWGVRDRATAEFMTRFYEALLHRRLSPEAALQFAQTAMRKDPRWSQPYYWAAFTMQGAR